MKARTTIIIVCILASTGIISVNPHEAYAAITPSRTINVSTVKREKYIGGAFYDSYLILRGRTRLCLEQVVYSLILDCGDIVFTPTELFDKLTSQRTPVTITEIRGETGYSNGASVSSALQNTIIEGYLEDTNDDIKVVIARSCSVFDETCSELRSRAY